MRTLRPLHVTVLLSLLTSLAHAAPEPPGAPEAEPAAGEAEAEPAAGEAEAEPNGLADPTQAATDEAAARAAFESTLSFKNGKVTVGNNLATLHVPDGFRYLGSEDAERVLVAWGNPPGSTQLGMLFPASLSPLDEASWGVVISYTEEGHVEDEDAADIDYDELLADMKKQTEADNAERKKQGFGTAHLIGWAEPPHYDTKTKKMYWAKELDFGSEKHTLNYDIRVLGRKGVLELSAVASIEQLAMIKREMPKVLGFVDFNPGSQYADFNPDVDEVAAYGLGALVAGKVAAKAGLFKVIVAGLLASKKLLAAGAIALVAAAKALLGRKKEEDVA